MYHTPIIKTRDKTNALDWHRTTCGVFLGLVTQVPKYHLIYFDTFNEPFPRSVPHNNNNNNNKEKERLSYPPCSSSNFK
jgi:hypothetical protein